MIQFVAGVVAAAALVAYVGYKFHSLAGVVAAVKAEVAKIEAEAKAEESKLSADVKAEIAKIVARIKALI